jgi:hypothetical protein
MGRGGVLSFFANAMFEMGCDGFVAGWTDDMSGICTEGR